MITGGCCHDYKKQKNIISEGISERVPTKWDIFFEMDQAKSKARLNKKVGRMVLTTFFTTIASRRKPAFRSSNPSPAFTRRANPLWLSIRHAFPIIGTCRPRKERKGLAGNARGQFQGARAQSRHYRQKGQEACESPDREGFARWLVDARRELYNVQKVYEGTTVLAHGDNGKAKEPQASFGLIPMARVKIFSTTRWPPQFHDVDQRVLGHVGQCGQVGDGQKIVLR